MPIIKAINEKDSVNNRGVSIGLGKNTQHLLNLRSGYYDNSVNVSNQVIDNDTADKAISSGVFAFNNNRPIALKVTDALATVPNTYLLGASSVTFESNKPYDDLYGKPNSLSTTINIGGKNPLSITNTGTINSNEPILPPPQSTKTLYVWGDNSQNQLSMISNAGYVNTPTQVGEYWSNVHSDGFNIIGIKNGYIYRHIAGIDTSFVKVDTTAFYVDAMISSYYDPSIEETINIAIAIKHNDYNNIYIINLANGSVIDVLPVNIPNRIKPLEGFSRAILANGYNNLYNTSIPSEITENSVASFIISGCLNQIYYDTENETFEIVRIDNMVVEAQTIDIIAECRHIANNIITIQNTSLILKPYFITNINKNTQSITVNLIEFDDMFSDSLLNESFDIQHFASNGDDLILTAFNAVQSNINIPQYMNSYPQTYYPYMTTGNNYYRRWVLSNDLETDFMFLNSETGPLKNPIGVNVTNRLIPQYYGNYFVQSPFFQIDPEDYEPDYPVYMSMSDTHVLGVWNYPVNEGAKLYGWGLGDRGQLGTVPYSNYYPNPTLISINNSLFISFIMAKEKISLVLA